MQKQLKRFGRIWKDLEGFRRILFLSIVMLLFGCQVEEFTIESQKSEIQKINFQRFTLESIRSKNPEILSFSNEALIEAKQRKIDKQGRLTNNSYEIDTTSVIYINYEDHSTYTFTVVTDPNAILLQNIVVADTPEGLYSYLAEYDLKVPIAQIKQDELGSNIKEAHFYELENPDSDNSRNTVCFHFGHYEDVNKCQGELVTPGENPGCFNADGSPKTVKEFVIGFSVCGESSGGNGGGTNPDGPGGSYPGTPSPGSGAGGGGNGSAPYVPPANGNPGNPSSNGPQDPGTGINPGGGGSGGGPKKPLITHPLYIPVPPRTLDTFLFYLSVAQQAWWNNASNSSAKQMISDFLVSYSYNDYSIGFGKWAIDYFRAHPNTTATQFQNWFMTPNEGKDGDYDAAFWENPNLSFEHPDLPSWNDFDAAYPKNPDGTYMMGADNVYSHVGGAVWQARLQNPSRTTNTCALKVSIALNYSGVIIPQIITTQNRPGTIQGADGKYYFLNARALNAWMRETFGVFPENPNHYNFTAGDGGINGENFPTLVSGIRGIYSLVTPNNPGVTGHADILNASNCAAGCNFNIAIEYIDIWHLD